MRRVLETFLDVLYPSRCLGCRRSIDKDALICQACWASIRKQMPPFCQKCGKEMYSFDKNADVLCNECRDADYLFERAYSVCRYEEPLKHCIHSFKYAGKKSLAAALSEMLIEFCKQHLDMRSLNLIVPVPLHPARQREREFNQAELLAKPLAETFGIEHGPKGLRRKTQGKAQSILNRELRLKNIVGAFEATQPDSLSGRSILLVDDVFTTGATVNECAKALRNARAKKVTVLTLARG
ncbi:MAG: ComF family protein [Candidatus Omnitrophota bacterium]